MNYVVKDNWIRWKYKEWVEVCKVDCLYEGEKMIVINNDEWIDWGVWEKEWKDEDIRKDKEKGIEKWMEINEEYEEKWKKIKEKKDEMKEEKEMEGVEGKLEK